MAIITLKYVYQIGDFDTTGGNIAPPNEQGAQAQGSPPFNIRLNPGASSQQLVLDDASNDGLDEINSTDQTLVNPITIDGVTYPAGSQVLVNYSLTDANGFRVYSITIGAGNSGRNTTTALISEQPLVPGQQYVFTQEGNIGNNEIDYAAIACFGAGTMIETAEGSRAVEDLNVGDIVRTADHGFQAIRWICSTRVAAEGKHAPVVFADGAIGNVGELVVSPAHRMLITGAQVELATGFTEALIGARHLVNGTTIQRRVGGTVRYFHILFDDHEIVFANGVPTESFYPNATESLTDEQRDEFRSLFPDFAEPTPHPMARPEIKAYEARVVT